MTTNAPIQKSLTLLMTLAVVFSVSQARGQEYDSLDRLIHRASSSQVFGKSQGEHAVCEAKDVTCLVPSTIAAKEKARRASFSSDTPINLTDPSPFPVRPQENFQQGEIEVVPLPIGHGMKPYDSARAQTIRDAGGIKPKFEDKAGIRKLNPNATPEEFVFDGNDRGPKVTVDQNWNVYGLETEDTIGHFDTLDGRRLVTASNRVAIYAPRFGSVRRVDGVFKAKISLPTGAYEEKIPVAQATAEKMASSSKQHLAVDRFDGSHQANEFVDETRGVVADNVTHLFGIRNAYEPFENLSIIRFGKYSKAESARLNLGMLSANVWEDSLGLQVAVKKISPVITKDVAGVEELITVESEDGTAILRVLKVASKISAKTGEFVDFTIRFDNLSPKKIGNVTIIDNLTTRLEYVPATSECSLNAKFLSEQNKGGSLMLRWEIIDPIPAGEGGIIRFRCKVR